MEQARSKSSWATWAGVLLFAALPIGLAWSFPAAPPTPEVERTRSSPRFELDRARFELAAVSGAPARGVAERLHWATLGEEKLVSARRGWVGESVELFDAAGTYCGRVERLSVSASQVGRYRWRGSLEWVNPPTTLQGRGWIHVRDGGLEFGR